jgi:hypothetical protein
MGHKHLTKIGVVTNSGTVLYKPNFAPKNAGIIEKRLPAPTPQGE